MGNQQNISPVVVHPIHIAGIDIPWSVPTQFHWLSLLPNNHWLPYLKLNGRTSTGEVSLLQHLLYQPFRPVRQPKQTRIETGEAAPSTMEVPTEFQTQASDETSDLPSLDDLFRRAMEYWEEVTGEYENGESNNQFDGNDDDEERRRWLPTSLRNRLMHFTKTDITTRYEWYVRSLIECWIKRVDANKIEVGYRTRSKDTPRASRRSRATFALAQRETPEMLHGGVSYEYATNVGEQNRTLYSDFVDRLLMGGTLVLRSYDNRGSGVIIMNSFDNKTGQIQPSMHESIQFRKVGTHRFGRQSTLSLTCSCSTFRAFQGEAKQEIDPLGEVDQQILTCFHCRFITDYLREACMNLESLDYEQETILLQILSESKRDHANQSVVLLGDIVAGQPIKFSVKCRWSKPAFVHISADRLYAMCRRGSCKSYAKLTTGDPCASWADARLCDHLCIMRASVDCWKQYIVFDNEPGNVSAPTRRHECTFNTESGLWEVQDGFILSKHKPTESDADERLIK